MKKLKNVTPNYVLNPEPIQFQRMAQNNVDSKLNHEDMTDDEYRTAICVEIEKLKSLHKAGKLKWEPRGTTGVIQK